MTRDEASMFSPAEIVLMGAGVLALLTPMQLAATAEYKRQVGLEGKPTPREIEMEVFGDYKGVEAKVA